MYYVYVLWSDRIRKRYVGFSDNWEERLKQHNKGQSIFTKRGIPWKPVRIETYSTAQEARQREKFLKSGVGRKFLDNCLNLRRDAGVV